jgi:hypothetical protein
MANPRGQQRDKPFRDALRMQLAAAGDDHKALREIADALIVQAKTGDIQAIREIGDRLDGKPAQAIEHSGEITKNFVARIPAKAATSEEWQQQHAPQTTQH